MGSPVLDGMGSPVLDDMGSPVQGGMDSGKGIRFARAWSDSLAGSVRVSRPDTERTYAGGHK
jgi:hypothetical protein